VRRARSFIAEASTPVLLIALAVIATLLSSLGPGYIGQVALQAIVTGVMVVGLYIFVGNSGVLSFGHLAFAMIGGYAGALLTLPSIFKAEDIINPLHIVVHTNVSPFFAVLIGGALAALVAAVVALPLMRIAGLTAGLASFAVLLTFHVVAQNWSSVTNGTEGLINVPTSTTKLSALGWLAFAIAAAYLYQRSRFGVRLRASREDEVAARAMGVRVPLERGIAFVLSAFVVGAGGALYAMALGTMSPDLAYLDLTLVVITMLVVGGLTSLSGAVIGTIVVAVVQEVLTRAEEGSVLGVFSITPRPGIAQTGLAIVLVILLILRPAGLMAGKELTLPKRLLRVIGGRASPAQAASADEAPPPTPPSTPAPPGVPEPASPPASKSPS
jgi:branched-chain amino acid transport system permease protein